MTKDDGISLGVALTLWAGADKDQSQKSGIDGSPKAMPEVSYLPVPRSLSPPPGRGLPSDRP
jgi:hypothetical protein